MNKNFTKKALLVLLVAVCLCALFVAVGCDETNKPPTPPSPPPSDNTTYTVSFNTGFYGLTVESISAKAGEAITQPADPQLDGYVFGGWLLNGEPYEFDTMPSSNITLTASWTKLYSVTFNIGSDVNPIVWYAPGETIQAPQVDDRNGYYFAGWLLDDEPYELGAMPAKNIALSATWELQTMPAMYINLDNGVKLDDVDRDSYVSSTITLTNTSKDWELDSVTAQFKGRGNGSWTASGDKKGYKIKFDSKQSLFGREKNKHWVIIACTNFDDTTMSRNYLAYNMANEIFDGIEYTTTAYWIEVYVNNEYRGVYLLCEHVRVSKGRVDIESEYGVNDTGYLVELDFYAKGTDGIDYFRVPGVKYAFTVHSPDPEDYATEGNISKAKYQMQVAFIKDYVTKVYQAAYSRDFNTFAEYADVDSFVDMYILHELFKNVDTGYSSFYLYKKPGGKLYAGPAWDFDATTNGGRGDTSPQGIYVAGEGQVDYLTSSELYINLYKTSGFRSEVNAHWKVLSPKIVTFIEGRLNDKVYETYREQMGRNFAKWKNKTQAKAENDWINDTKKLKTWLLDRIAWLDAEWK